MIRSQERLGQLIGACGAPRAKPFSFRTSMGTSEDHADQSGGKGSTAKALASSLCHTSYLCTCSQICENFGQVWDYYAILPKVTQWEYKVCQKIMICMRRIRSQLR